MRKRMQIIVVMVVLLAAQLACNMPTTDEVSGSDSTAVAPQDQTLTALVRALTPGANATTTPPFLITATEDGVPGSPTQAPGGANGTVTPAPAGNSATATAVARQPTVPNLRPRSPVTAQFLSTPPTIDGDWSEWKDITEEYPATSVVFGRENWSGASDLAASFHAGWDNEYFYIAVKVIDDAYAQNATGEDLFRGDSIEILLDTNLQEDFYYNSLSPDDFQFGISPGRPDPNGPKEAYLWLPSNVAGPRTGINIAARQESGQYRVEAAIPWHVFETRPNEGEHMGFALSVSDNDNTNENAQQSMVSNVADRRLTDPTTWGDIHFVR